MYMYFKKSWNIYSDNIVFHLVVQLWEIFILFFTLDFFL